jgi:hypothetical protein
MFFLLGRLIIGILIKPTRFRLSGFNSFSKDHVLELCLIGKCWNNFQNGSIKKAHQWRACKRISWG